MEPRPQQWKQRVEPSNKPSDRPSEPRPPVPEGRPRRVGGGDALALNQPIRVWVGRVGSIQPSVLFIYLFILPPPLPRPIEKAGEREASTQSCSWES